jgi:hypothetical protein
VPGEGQLFMKMVQGRWRHAVTVVTLVTLLGCTGGGDTPEPDGGAGSEAPGAPGGTAGAAVDADERLRLERALGHHAMLVIDAMRAAADDTARQGLARRSVRRNTTELGESAAEALDVDDAFADAWTQRVDALLALAAGEGADDDDLTAAHEEYGAAISEALGDRLPAADAAAQLAELDDALTTQVEAYRDGTLPAAYTAQREAYSTAVRLGQQLVRAAGATPEATSGAVELRSALQQLLGEHAALIAITTRHAARGSDQTAQAGAALAGNSEDLTAALLSIYDERAAVRFDEAWRDAIAASVDAAVAASELDERGRRRARRQSDAAVDLVADAVVAMTEDSIERREVAQRFTRHFRLLHRHGTQVANGRWQRAYRQADRVHASGAALGAWLAEVIAEQRADEFPQK